MILNLDSVLGSILIESYTVKYLSSWQKKIDMYSNFTQFTIMPPNLISRRGFDNVTPVCLFYTACLLFLAHSLALST